MAALVPAERPMMEAAARTLMSGESRLLTGGGVRGAFCNEEQPAAGPRLWTVPGLL